MKRTTFFFGLFCLIGIILTGCGSPQTTVENVTSQPIAELPATLAPTNIPSSPTPIPPSATLLPPAPTSPPSSSTPIPDPPSPTSDPPSPTPLPPPPTPEPPTPTAPPPDYTTFAGRNPDGTFYLGNPNAQVTLNDNSDFL